jgi:mRNA interferase RelE/StbE
MNYKISILRRAQKELADLPQEIYLKVRDNIYELSLNPRPHSCSKLVGRDGWRIVVGNYRVIYEVNDKDRTITVLHIGHRRDIYR